MNSSSTISVQFAAVVPLYESKEVRAYICPKFSHFGFHFSVALTGFFETCIMRPFMRKV